MLENEFFKMQSYNAGPYPVINLSGNEKYEQNTVFRPGRYLIEVAPGLDSWVVNNTGDSSKSMSGFVYIRKEEIITEKFIIRAYCGSDSTGSGSPGTNSYIGPFKVNGVDATTLTSGSGPTGIDVNHIFGAGGGNCHAYYHSHPVGLPDLTLDTYLAGGGNCLGNGSIYLQERGTNPYNAAGGAGSCLHILPENGVFGTDYLRAYHINGYQVRGAHGSVFGGGASGAAAGNTVWFTRGGNSPYGNGGTTQGSDGQGTGSGKNGSSCSAVCFDGNSWTNTGTYVDALSAGVPAESSYIRVTYLGPLE